jgi:hypothetical protein
LLLLEVAAVVASFVEFVVVLFVLEELESEGAGESGVVGCKDCE